jgi:hypothetical protein
MADDQPMGEGIGFAQSEDYDEWKKSLGSERVHVVEINREADALERIGNILASFNNTLFSPQLTVTGEPDGPSFAERLMDLLESPMAVVNFDGAEKPYEPPKLDPTYAALAGNCFGFATALRQALEEPDQFKKSKALRELVSAAEGMGKANKDRAEAEKYAIPPSNVVSDGTMDQAAAATPDMSNVNYIMGALFPKDSEGVQHACSLPPKAWPKDVGYKNWTCPDCHQSWSIGAAHPDWWRSRPIKDVPQA